MKAYLRSDYPSAAAVMADMDLLAAKYLKRFKRKLKIDLLLSSGGTEKKPVYEMTCRYAESDVEEVEWAIEELINPRPVLEVVRNRR